MNDSFETSLRETHEAIVSAIYRSDAIAAFIRNRCGTQPIWQWATDGLEQSLLTIQSRWESVRFAFAKARPDDLTYVGTLSYSSHHEAAFEIADEIYDLVYDDLERREWPDACDALRESLPTFDVNELLRWLRKEFALVSDSKQFAGISGNATNGTASSNADVSHDPKSKQTATIVHIDTRTCKVTIDGHDEEWTVTPHLAAMLNSLVEAKEDETFYRKGPELKSLPSCKGKNVYREIQNLKKTVPPLLELIESSKLHGYWLTD